MTKQKPVIFLDFDGLKFETIPVYISYINKKYNIETHPKDYINNPPIEDIVKRYLPENKHHTIIREEVYVDLAKNVESCIELNDSAKPVSGLCDVLPLLADKYELWTVTAKQKSGQPTIEHLLNKYVPNCITGIHCVWEYQENVGYKEFSKRDFILNFQGEKVAFIDDSPKEILRTQDIIPSYLFDPNSDNAHFVEIERRVRGWEEIGKIFL